MHAVEPMSKPEVLAPRRARGRRGSQLFTDENLDLLSHVLDDWFRIPGTSIRFGIDGIVASAAEAADLRKKIGSMLLVTPGIRPAGDAAGDQKRIVTPKDAIAAGADYLVIGRPVLSASNPKAAAEAIVTEIASALK